LPFIITTINTKIEVPPYTEIGSAYTLTLSVVTSGTGEGTLTFGSAIDQNFKVIVGEDPRLSPKEPIDYKKISYVVMLLLIVAIVVYMVRKKQKGSNVEKSKGKNKVKSKKK